LQYKDVWTTVVPDTFAASTAMTVTNVAGTSMYRFYRALLVP